MYVCVCVRVGILTLLVIYIYIYITNILPPPPPNQNHQATTTDPALPCPAVLLGHHRGDVQENVLSNAMRGVGPLHLSGMGAVSFV